MKPVEGVLALPYSAAEGADRWCTCLLCGSPRDVNAGLGEERYVGEPVEYITGLQGDGTWHGVGLHQRCIERHERLLHKERRSAVPTNEDQED